MHDVNVLKAALNQSDDLIIIGTGLQNGSQHTEDSKILFANYRVAKSLGQPAEALAGRTLREALPADAVSAIYSRAISLAETGLPQHSDCQIAFKPGDLRWYTVSLQGEGDTFFAAFRDTTLSRQAEQNFRKTIDELKRSNQNLERFAYVASHDLQEPLRKLAGFGDILQEEYGQALGESGIRLVHRMQLATQRMHNLIKDLLAFSRVTSVRSPFQRVNLQEVVDVVLSDLEPTIREKKAVVDITSLPYVEGDAGQLGQLFQNLFSNALKFINPGDIPLLRVDCEVIPGAAIEPMPGTSVTATDRDRSFFAITVSDNGLGFDEKYLDRIFTLFQRLHTRTEFPGTGIGLAIAQKVVENHGGYLNAHSQPGRGAEFVVYLPDEPAQLHPVRL